jgi:hypothetical protein
MGVERAVQIFESVGCAFESRRGRQDVEQMWEPEDSGSHICYLANFLSTVFAIFPSCLQFACNWAKGLKRLFLAVQRPEKVFLK